MTVYDQLTQRAAEISIHLDDYPFPTPAEEELLKTIRFLCDAVIKLSDGISEAEEAGYRRGWESQT